MKTEVTIVATVERDAGDIEALKLLKPPEVAEVVIQESSDIVATFRDLE